jgi:hypothetical protein
MASASTTPATLSAVVRSVLVANRNNPLKLNVLWDKVKEAAPTMAKSKSHFSKGIIGNMLVREELAKERVPEAHGKDKVRLAYGYRLRGTGKVKRLVESSLGISINLQKLRRMAPAAPAAVVAANEGSQELR